MTCPFVGCSWPVRWGQIMLVHFEQVHGLSYEAAWAFATFCHVTAAEVVLRRAGIR